MHPGWCWIEKQDRQQSQDQSLLQLEFYDSAEGVW